MKERIDRWLVLKGLFPTREKARRAVMAGEVMVGTTVIDKASRILTPEEAGQLVVRSRDRAVSRAYYKLDRALALFPVQVAGKVCLDVGASTGGFTQRLLEAGAVSVYAVDCGTNQLDYSLRSDGRVRVMEKTNARYLDASMFSPSPELAVMDVSFISVNLIIPVLAGILEVPELVVLIKPQFEAGKEQVGRGGIVREPVIWKDVLTRVVTLSAGSGYGCAGLAVSPITGGEGNVEFLAHFLLSGTEGSTGDMIDGALAEAVALFR